MSTTTEDATLTAYMEATQNVVAVLAGEEGIPPGILPAVHSEATIKAHRAAIAASKAARSTTPSPTGAEK